MKGITFSKTENKWLVRYYTPNKNYYVGRYKNEELAKTAFNSFEKGLKIQV